jgi:alpha-1,4-digalacturonate transport system permease protein
MFKTLLTRKAGGRKANWRDWVVYAYLALGVIVMLGPVLWAALSSLKTQDSIQQYPPEIIPQSYALVDVEGYDEPLPLYKVTEEDGDVVELAQIRRIGIEAQMVDPENPTEIIRVPVSSTQAVRDVHLQFSNYVDPLNDFNFGTYFQNSTLVTVVATLVTLLITSMAAFALSKYRFRGRGLMLGLIVSQLLIPGTVLLVPTFVVVSWLGWFNSYNALIWPLVATPTGVFLLRQYMLTIPDDMLDAARIDGASEWRVYWETVLPLSAPAISVLAIFSVMWRWNDFVWPLIVISDTEKYTLPLALSRFSGEYTTSWEQLLAMTVLTLLPITVIFGFLQKYVTTGIASMGVKG